MNTYTFKLFSSTGDGPQSGDLRALAIASLFAKKVEANLVYIGSSALQCLQFDLPFSLSNLNLKDVSQLSYATQFQAVNEFSDKPYPVKGLLCVVFEDHTMIGQSDKDFDNFVSYDYKTSTLGDYNITNKIKIGIVNSTQTDFYTPFENIPSTEKVFYQIPNNIVVTPQQLEAMSSPQPGFRERPAPQTAHTPPIWQPR